MAVPGRQTACLTRAGRMPACQGTQKIRQARLPVAETGKLPVLHLFQREFYWFLWFARNQVISRNDPRAGIPAQNGIVVA
jgi:hypothetical protein